MRRNNVKKIYLSRGSPKEHFRKIILKSGHWSRSCHLKVFLLFFFSSGGHFVQWSRTILALFVRGSPKKHFCEIILKSVHWSRRCHLEVFSIFRSGSHFVQQSRTILAILVEGYQRNISVKLFWKRSIGLEDDVISKEHFHNFFLKSGHWSLRWCHLKVFLFLALAAILFSGAERF